MTRPALRVVRADDPPPLELPDRRRRRDSAGLAASIVALMFAGTVLMAVAMGWLR